MNALIVSVGVVGVWAGMCMGVALAWIARERREADRRYRVRRSLSRAWREERRARLLEQARGRSWR